MARISQRRTAPLEDLWASGVIAWPEPANASASRLSYPETVKFPVTIERDETGMFVAECPSIPGCVSQGHTEDEALANIHEAIVGCLETRAAQGLPLTIRTIEVEVAVA